MSFRTKSRQTNFCWSWFWVFKTAFQREPCGKVLAGKHLWLIFALGLCLLWCGIFYGSFLLFSPSRSDASKSDLWFHNVFVVQMLPEIYTLLWILQKWLIKTYLNGLFHPRFELGIVCLQECRVVRLATCLDQNVLSVCEANVSKPTSE